MLFSRDAGNPAPPAVVQPNVRRLVSAFAVVLLPVMVAATACGESTDRSVDNASAPTSGPTTSATTSPPPTPSTSAGAPVASLKPVAPIGVDPTAPLPGPCTQSETSSICPPDPEAVTRQFVGLTEAEAAAQAAARGWAFRVAERDGEQFQLTQDYNPARLNVAVQNGTVTRAWAG
jgi:hypothetical protein